MRQDARQRLPAAPNRTKNFEKHIFGCQFKSGIFGAYSACLVRKSMLNFSIYNVTNTHYKNYDHNYISTMHCHLTSTLSTSDFLCPSARANIAFPLVVFFHCWPRQRASSRLFPMPSQTALAYIYSSPAEQIHGASARLRAYCRPNKCLPNYLFLFFWFDARLFRRDKAPFRQTNEIRLAMCHVRVNVCVCAFLIRFDGNKNTFCIIKYMLKCCIINFRSIFWSSYNIPYKLRGISPKIF